MIAMEEDIRQEETESFLEHQRDCESIDKKDRSRYPRSRQREKAIYTNDERFSRLDVKPTS